jgi:hypothetical protein
MNKYIRSIDDDWESDEYILIQFDQNGKIGEHEIKVWDEDLQASYKAALVYNYEACDIPPLLIGKITNGNIQKRNTCVYFKNNLVHRDNDEPAIITKTAEKHHIKAWYKDGKLHRENGPAIESFISDCYYLNNEFIKSVDRFDRAEHELPEEMLKDSTPTLKDPKTGLYCYPRKTL